MGESSVLRIIQNSSSAGAKRYYSTADYYAEGQELVGCWRGNASKRLGLDGVIAKKDWDALCDNLDPATGATLTARRKQERRVGYDFNFHAPKSLSLLYGLTQDERLLAAFREAVYTTMQEMEREACVRVRTNGRNEDRSTGNLIWGEFMHLTARPENGAPDPHLHAHCFVFNASFDGREDRWKAIQLGGIKRDAPYFEAVFHARLARSMEALGLATTRTRHGWELAELDAQTLAKFSRRTAHIERVARELGITDPRAKAELGATTRSRKSDELTMPELRSLWHERLEAPEAQALDQLAESVGGRAIATDRDAAREAAGRAVEHLFERASVVPERMLLREALRQGVGRAERGAIEAAVAGHGLIRAERDGRMMATTREVLREETAMLDFARKGRGACRPLAAGPVSFHREWLGEEQKTAVRHVLSSRDRVILVRGAAGTGKTTMMQEVRDAVEASGQRILAFAPSASASRGVLREDGFETADTVARLLADEAMQREAKGALIWIDEAGLLGTKTLRQVFELADRTGARVLLTGDRRQHGSVERGAALRLLEDEAGLRPAEIKAIQRQRERYRDAVKALSEGQTALGFERLDRLGWIREAGGSEREGALADAYLASVRQGDSTLVVSPTHGEGQRITAAIRERMKQEGFITGEARRIEQLVPANLTIGQKRDTLSYEPGDVLVFHQNAKGHRKGERLVVGQAGVPFDQAERFTVFRKASLELAPGDHLRITKNGRSLDDRPLSNGDLYRLDGFTKAGDLRVSPLGGKGAAPRTIPRDYGHLAHGFVVTSHASQGKTVDRVIIGQSSDSLPASSREQFYVSVSRGRKQALIFTDDKEGLLEAVGQSHERTSGTELAAEAARQRVLRQRAMEAVLAGPVPFERERTHDLEPAHV